MSAVLGKCNQKYGWISHVIFYHLAKFEMEGKFVQDALKK
jgi:hypothetical protein